MQPSPFHQLVCGAARRLALPIATYPGLSLTGGTVRDLVTNPRVQLQVQAALCERYRSPFALTAMDLSTEAEAFGCEVLIPETEIPAVTGRLITSLEAAQRLPVPQPGDSRTAVALETVGLLAKLPGRPFVLGGCIGPFSLAARLTGVSEALELTLTDPDLMHTVLAKCAGFLAAYLKEFRAAGASGVIMAEPAAGLLSPRGLSVYSSAYIKRIAAEVCDASFNLLLHNCAAKLLHLPAIQETGLQTFHFGAPMDIVGALDQVSPEVILCGNLDPTAVFTQSPPEEVTTRTTRLLTATTIHRNFVISSGCDLPLNSPLASLDAFYEAVAAFNTESQP